MLSFAEFLERFSEQTVEYPVSLLWQLLIFRKLIDEPTIMAASSTVPSLK